MSYDFEKSPLNTKFSFFKRETIAKKKMSTKNKLLCGLCIFMVFSVENGSVNKFKEASLQFQQKSIHLYQPDIESKAVSNHKSNELLVGYLAQRDINFDDLNRSIDVVKANKKTLPDYLVPFVINKLKSDNIALYLQNTQELRHEYQKTFTIGLTRLFIGERVRDNNRNKFREYLQIHNENFENMETKINSLLGSTAKEIQPSPSVKTPKPAKHFLK